MKKYSVGQILYIIPSNQKAIVPVMIVEELTRKTLDGETVEYLVKNGYKPEQTVNLSSIVGEVFDSPELVKAELLKRTNISINNMISRVLQLEESVFGVKSSRREESHDDVVESTSYEKEDVTLVKMPDGSIAKVKNIAYVETK